MSRRKRGGACYGSTGSKQQLKMAGDTLEFKLFSVRMFYICNSHALKWVAVAVAVCDRSHPHTRGDFAAAGAVAELLHDVQLAQRGLL